MSIFNRIKSVFSVEQTKNKEMYCSSCGSSDLKYSKNAMVCNNCNFADDRIEVLENCYLCGAEIKLNTKYYKANNSRNICCQNCKDELIEEKEMEEQDNNFFDLYKNCKVCGKQYKVNNKSNDEVCYSCQLEDIKKDSFNAETILKKEIKYCKNCGIEFYAKNYEEVCDICKKV